MKNYTKRIFSFLLIIAVIFSLNISSYAAEEPLNLIEEDKSVSVIQDENRVLVDQLEQKSIQYEYELGAIISKDGTCEASLFFTLPGADQEKVAVKGVLETIEDSVGKTFLTGPLEGSTVIQGKEYEVLVGFTKDLQTEKVNAGVTIFNSGNAVEEIVFAFGEKIERKIDMNIEGSKPSISPYAFENLATASGKINNTNTTGVKVYGDYEKKSKRFKIRLKSYITSVEKYYKDIRNDVRTIRVSKYKLGLKRMAETPKSHIVGIEEDIKGGSGVLSDIFSDLLSLLDIPGATILGAAKGTVDVAKGTANSYVEVKVHAGSTVDFDSKYFPIVYQLARNSGVNSAATQKYQFYGSLQYNLTGHNPQKGVISFYSNTEVASETVSISI